MEHKESFRRGCGNPNRLEGTKANGSALLPRFPVTPLGQPTPAGELASTRAPGTGASPQPAARPSASRHPLSSLGGFCVTFFSPLHASLSPRGENKTKQNKTKQNKTSPKVSNCKQIRSSYLFISSVSTVLGLVLPGILNRLPLLSAAHPRLLPSPSPGRGRSAEPRRQGKGTAAGREDRGCPPRPRAAVPGPEGQVPACAAPRKPR